MSKPGRLVAMAIENELKPPYPAFQEAEIALLEKALRLVWSECQSKEAKDKVHKMDLMTAKEEEVSYAIAVTLDLLMSNKTRALQAFLEAFHVDNPEPKLANYDRTSINKKCDFSFSRRFHTPGASSLNEALFAEAKLVTPTQTMSYYAGSGIKRFLDGQYAHCMPQAMLLGYVRETTQVLPSALAGHFARDGGKKAQELCVAAGPAPVTMSKFAKRMYWTDHTRVDGAGKALVHPNHGTALGPIRLFHLWLDID